MTDTAEQISSENTVETTQNAQVETQETAPQAEVQADTTQQNAEVSSDLGIEDSEGSETPEQSAPTIDDIVSEYLTGEISEETQKLIDENGLGQHLELIAEGKRVIQERDTNEVYNTVGGKEAYLEVQEWAKVNLNEAQKAAFNKALFSGDMEQAKLAVQGLQARYIAANGKEPSRMVESGSTANESSRPFGNVHEYLNETRSFKYKSDPEYRAQIEHKRNISGF